MVISGIVYDCRENSCFTIKIKDKLVYFHLQRNLIKKFGKYIKTGVYVNFEVEEEKVKVKTAKCYKVTYFNKILNRRSNKYYYTIDFFREGIKNLLNNLENIAFMDFEFNMQDFYPIKNFVGEIIEVGYCLCDKDLNTIKQKNIHLIPTKIKKITKRTIKFLNYKQEQLNEREKYLVFYHEFVGIVNKYDPTFIVWGKSDIDSLKLSFNINKVPYVNFKFIDLSQIHVNYYNLKNSPGLFKMAESYNNTELPKQSHNALEDALVTKLVFSKFKETIK